MGQNIPAKIVNIRHNLTLHHYLAFGDISMNCKNFQDSKSATHIFFINIIPQVNDLLELEYHDRTEETVDITHLGSNDAKQYPKKLLGYEVLLDDNLDLDMPKPVGK